MFGRLLGKRQEVAKDEASAEAQEQSGLSEELRAELERTRHLLNFAAAARCAQADQMMRRGGGWRPPREERPGVTYREPETLEELRACLNFANTARANGVG